MSGFMQGGSVDSGEEYFDPDCVRISDDGDGVYIRKPHGRTGIRRVGDRVTPLMADALVVRGCNIGIVGDGGETISECITDLDGATTLLLSSPGEQDAEISVLQSFNKIIEIDEVDHLELLSIPNPLDSLEGETEMETEVKAPMNLSNSFQNQLRAIQDKDIKEEDEMEMRDQAKDCNETDSRARQERDTTDQDPSGELIVSVDRESLKVKGSPGTDQLADGCDLLELMERTRQAALRSTDAFEKASRILVALQGRMEGEPKEDHRQAHHNSAVGTANDWLESKSVVGPGWISVMTLYECYIHAALVRVKSLADFINAEATGSDDDETSTVMGGLGGYLYNIHDLANRSIDVAECADQAYYNLYGANAEERAKLDSDVEGWLPRLHSDIEVIHDSLSHIADLLDSLIAGNVVIEPDVESGDNS